MIKPYFYAGLIVVLLSSCATITNRFHSTRTLDSKLPQQYDKYSFSSSDVYAVRVEREVQLEYIDPKTGKAEYSDAPYPTFHVLNDSNREGHIVEENYFIFLDNQEKANSESGILLFLSTQYIKIRSLQTACFNDTSYFSTYAIQSVEAGKWRRSGLKVDLSVYRGLRDSVRFKGILSNGKLMLTETDHPKQNPSSLFANEQPMIEIKKMLNLDGAEGLLFYAQPKRKLVHPNWKGLLTQKKADGKRLKANLDTASMTQNFDEIWINLNQCKGKQFVIVDSSTGQALVYKKRIKYPELALSDCFWCGVRFRNRKF